MFKVVKRYLSFRAFDKLLINHKHNQIVIYSFIRNHEDSIINRISKFGYVKIYFDVKPGRVINDRFTHIYVMRNTQFELETIYSDLVLAQSGFNAFKIVKSIQSELVGMLIYV